METVLIWISAVCKAWFSHCVNSAMMCGLLVESYRTKKGPRQRTVAYLGQLKDSTRKGIKQILTS